MTDLLTIGANMVKSRWAKTIKLFGVDSPQSQAVLGTPEPLCHLNVTVVAWHKRRFRSPKREEFHIAIDAYVDVNEAIVAFGKGEGDYLVQDVKGSRLK